MNPTGAGAAERAAALVAARAEPGELVEAVVRQARRRHVRLAGGEVTAVSDSTSVSVLVRSVRGGAVGCAGTSRTDGAALDWAVRQARSLRPLTACRLAGAADGGPLASVPDRWPELAELSAVPLAGAVAELRELERAGLAAVPGARPLGADWAQTCEVISIANSAGRSAHYPHPEHALSLSLGRAGPTGRATALAGRVRPAPVSADRTDIVAELAAELRAGDGPPAGGAAAGDAAAGRPPSTLVLAPRAAARLLSQVGAAFYGDRPDLDRGGLRELGRQVLPAGFDLLDDAADPHGLVSAPCDDEGTPARQTTVVRDGRLRTLLHDRSSADPAAGERSTGNGWSVPRGAGVGYGIAVAAANLRLAGPATTPAALLAGAGHALYASRLDDGGGRGVDAPADRVRLTLSGWLLRGGEPAGRVSAATVTMPLSTLLLRMRRLSDQRQYYRIGARSTLRMGPAVAGSHVLFDDVPIVLGAAG